MVCLVDGWVGEWEGLEDWVVDVFVGSCLMVLFW